MFGRGATCVGVQLADLCCYKFSHCSILLTPDRNFCGILCFTGNIQVIREDEMRGRNLFVDLFPAKRFYNDRCWSAAASAVFRTASAVVMGRLVMHRFARRRMVMTDHYRTGRRRHDHRTRSRLRYDHRLNRRRRRGRMRHNHRLRRIYHPKCPADQTDDLRSKMHSFIVMFVMSVMRSGKCGGRNGGDEQCSQNGFNFVVHSPISFCWVSDHITYRKLFLLS